MHLSFLFCYCHFDEHDGWYTKVDCQVALFWGGGLFPVLCNIKIIHIVIYCYHYMAMMLAVLHHTKCVLFHFDFFMNLSLKLLHFCWLNRGATDKYLGIPMQFKQENVLETRLGINYAYRGPIWS